MSVAKADTDANVCKSCGMAITYGAPHGRHAEGNVYESCFLGTIKHAPVWSAPEMPYVSLTEALATALDALDAMTSDRPYRKGLSFDDAKAEIRRMSSAQFDPVAVEVLLKEEPTLRKMVEIKCTRPVSVP